MVKEKITSVAPSTPADTSKGGSTPWVCDICGKPATNAVQDIRQINTGKVYMEFEPYGDRRYGCQDHIVGISRTYYLNDFD